MSNDMPKEIAAWRFAPEKADEWVHGGWSEDHDHKTVRYIRERQAQPVGVKVKPLTWDEGDIDGLFFQSTESGTTSLYKVMWIIDNIDNRGTGWYLLIGEIEVNKTPFPSEEAAKAAAQADYEARIDALIQQAVSEERERCAQVADELEQACAKWVLSGLGKPVASEMCAQIAAAIREGRQ